MLAKKSTKLGRLQRQFKTGTCPKCRRNTELCVDHIVPVFLLEQLGLFEEITEDEENFELVCYACNQYKGSRLDLTNPKTIILLNKYIRVLNKEYNLAVIIEKLPL